MTDLVFPDGFLWGASTSSYQIEGGAAHADWVQWERAGAVPDSAAQAADSWNRFREDVDLAASLGHPCTASRPSGRASSRARAHRPRGRQPATPSGSPTRRAARHADDARALALHQPRLADRARGLGVVGGTGALRGFVRAVVPALAPHVDWWATINEANTYAHHGWLMGDWPPGKRNDYPGGFAAYAGLAEGHVRARRAIKEILGEATPVGLTHVFPWTHPAEKSGVSPGPVRRTGTGSRPGTSSIACAAARLAGRPVLLRRAVHGSATTSTTGRRRDRHGLAHRPAGLYQAVVPAGSATASRSS